MLANSTEHPDIYMASLADRIKLAPTETLRNMVCGEEVLALVRAELHRRGEGTTDIIEPRAGLQ